ncbi:hypothetical protein [Entomobacter blattae]|uniref:Uncharacterized protein n=1 Tax=Entomobacter blattae TaxID=2762277 RepID=A0A7H1NNI6_9PROT|nr:hypothetical protein [Entomobacter blattae]QNT77346.1 hypothetical protein JGUZn3_00790 [Entomobacter blattae]
MKTVLLPSLLAGSYFALAFMIATPTFAQNSQRTQPSAIPRSDNVAPTSTATPDTDYSRYKPVTYDTETSSSDSVTSQKPSGLPSVTANQTPREPYNGPALEAGGMRFFFNAPVSPPYNASSTYTTYAGQPGGGWNATGQQGAAGEP